MRVALTNCGSAIAAIVIAVWAAKINHVAVYFTSAHDYGIVQTLVDEVSVGGPIDTYCDIVQPIPRTSLGVVELAAGNHRLTFRMTGKNVASTGYLAGIDSVELETITVAREKRP